MSSLRDKLFKERNLSFMKHMKVNKHTMVTAATALLTLASIGASPATIYAASDNSSEIVSVKSEPDSYTKDSLTKLISVVQSKAFQDKVANEKNESDANALKQALSAAQNAIKDDSSAEMTNTGRNLHRIAVKIDRVNKKQLGNLLEIGRSHKSDTTVSKPYQNAQNVNDNLGADLSLIRDAASSLITGLNQDGVAVEVKKDAKADANDSKDSSSSSSSEDASSNGDSSSSASQSSDSTSTKTDSSKGTSQNSEKGNDSGVMYGGTGRKNLTDPTSSLIKSPITPSYKNQLDQNIHTAESQDMQRKTTLASKDTQEDLDMAIKDGKAMVNSKDSKLQDQANATLLKAMNRVDNEAKEPLKLLDGEMKIFSESNGFKKLDDTVQQDYNNTMQKIETVLSDANATYGDIIAAETAGHNTLNATLTSSDKTLLRSAIDEADALATGDLAKKAAKNNLSSLTTQVALARQVLSDKNASQGNVDQAAQALRNAEMQFLTTLANSEAGKDRNTDSMKNQVTSLNSNNSTSKKTSRSSALQELGNSIRKAKSIKNSNAYKHADTGTQVAFTSALNEAELVYGDPGDYTVSQIEKTTQALNRVINILGGKETNSNSTNSNNSRGEDDDTMYGGTGRSNSNDSNGSSRNGDSTTAGDTPNSTSSNRSRGVLPQTGHFIIQHAKAIMATIAVAMAGLVGFWYKNNKDKDNEDKINNKKA